MTSSPAISKNKTVWLHIALIAGCVLIAYGKVFTAGFLSWDDGEYILRNPDIRGLNVANIKAWFSGFYVGNYHPFTLLSYATDFALGATKPFVYHATSVLLHIGNAMLVYLLLKKLQPQVMVSLAVALIFALHPAQTESVSWIAERKTVLSGLFSLLAMLFYAGYVGDKTARKMFWVIVAGGAAMLSKGTAVALPLSLLAMDIWLKRPLNEKKVWTEKFVLFGIALVVGIVALKAQESGKFLDTHTSYSATQSIIYGGYAYVQYIVRLFIPVSLSAMYPYPTGPGLLQYLYLILAMGAIPMAYIAYRRKWYVLSGGLVFYTVNIMLLLQFIHFGEALMADRYMYIACLGLVYPAVHYSYGALRQRGRQLATGIITVVLLALTFFRTDAWLSDFNFFNAMLDTFPNSAVTQYSVGALYMQKGDYAQAELHLDKAVRIDPNNYKAWHNKGALHLRQGRAMEALEALDRSIAINGYPKAYFTRALLHHSTGRLGLALADIDRVLKAQPQNSKAWLIKGNCLEQEGNLGEALTSYNKAISFDDREPLAFIRRGLVFSKTNKIELGIKDLETATMLNPQSADAYYYLGMIKHQAGRNPCPDLSRAERLGQLRAKDAIDQFCKGRLPPRQ